MLRKFRPATIPCLRAGCDKLFKTLGGHKRHDDTAHTRHGSWQAGAVPPPGAASPPPSEPDVDPEDPPDVHKAAPNDFPLAQGLAQDNAPGMAPEPALPGVQVTETHPIIRSSV